MDIVFVIVCGLGGILAGGVVNALADDLPFEKPLQLPHYPDWTPRPPIAWLGVLAFLTGRRASPEESRLRWRHVWVELAMGLIYVLMALTYPLSSMDWPEHLRFLFLLIFLAIMMLVTVIDMEYRLVIPVMMFPAYLLAILASMLVFNLPPNFPPYFVDALVGGVLGFVVYFVMFQGGALFSYLVAVLRGRPLPEVAFGSGDVWLGILSGLLLGWRLFFLGWMITVFVGGFGAVLYLIYRALLGARYKAFTPLPYGPYIMLGTVVMMLGGEQVVKLLLR